MDFCVNDFDDEVFQNDRKFFKQHHYQMTFIDFEAFRDMYLSKPEYNDSILRAFKIFPTSFGNLMPLEEDNHDKKSR